MIHIGLFEGTGGFSLAAEWAGWETLATCEINPFGQRVLKHYWPNAYHHGDIHTLTYETINAELTNRFGTHWRDEDVIITGGFPCQPYSVAGKRLGKEDERHLWPEMLRVIQEVQPTYVVGENVRGLLSWDGGLVFDEVQADLEAAGYEVIPFILPAAGVNAPHRRDRIWFIAHSNNYGLHGPKNRQGNTEGDDNNSSWKNAAVEFSGRGGKATNEVTENSISNGCIQREPIQEGAEVWEQRNVGAGGAERVHIPEGAASNTNSRRQSRKEYRQEKPEWIAEYGIPGNWDYFPTQSPVRNGDAGLSNRLVGITFPKWRNESIKAMGNAIVPQVAFQIFKAINLMIHSESN